jgi:hypothetical protein
MFRNTKKGSGPNSQAIKFEDQVQAERPIQESPG